MDYYCEVCDKFIKPKSKYNHFKSNTHKEFAKNKHMELTIENPDISNIDEVLYPYIFQHNKQYDHFLIKCHFQLVFNENQYSTWIKSNFLNKKALISWKKDLENLIEDFENKGYDFNHIEEMNILTISNKMDMSYDFYIKQNMHMIEWKLNAMINKNKNLINNFIETWRHPLSGKFRNN